MVVSWRSLPGDGRQAARTGARHAGRFNAALIDSEARAVIADAYPGLKICAAHAGGYLPSYAKHLRAAQR
jgi:hypothetical protein